MTLMMFRLLVSPVQRQTSRGNSKLPHATAGEASFKCSGQTCHILKLARAEADTSGGAAMKVELSYPVQLVRPTLAPMQAFSTSSG
jgi:hypothetical protein